MNHTPLYILLLLILSTPVHPNAVLTLNVEFAYECDSIWEFGDLSIKEFTVTPLEDADLLSSSNVALLVTTLISKNIAMQIALMKKNDPQKIAALIEQLEHKRNNRINQKLRIHEESIKRAKFDQATNENRTLAKNRLRQIFQANDKEFLL